MSLDAARSARRCGAKTRCGGRCAGPAMLNGRCRMHGGKSTGPKTAEGLQAIRHLKTQHGKYTQEMAELRTLIRSLKAEQKALREKV